MNFKNFNIMFILITIIIKSTNYNINAEVNLLNLDDIPAKGVVVMDMDTGRLLYGKNENLKMAMASTTKIMTALITLEQPDLDSYFEVDPDAIKIEGTSMGLLEGDKVTLRSLATGMLLPSGNDAAEAAAVKIAGNRQSFINLMNERAASFGCKNTHFATVSGLDDDNHYSTPKDMANITRYALRNDNFVQICKQEYKTVEYGNPPYKRTLKNHNKLLSRYEYCIGVKTGFTDNAGKCLISASTKDNINLIVVTFNSNDICESHIKIYEKAFDQLRKYTPSVKLPVHDIKVLGGEIINVPIEKQYDTEISIVKGEEEKITNKIKLKKFLFAPIKKGDVIGEIDYYIDDLTLSSEPITTSMDVKPEPNKSFWNRILDNLTCIKLATLKYNN